MEELLKKLLEAEILTEDTKSDLEAAFQAQLAEAVETAEAEASENVRAELTEQWVAERDVLIEAVDTKVNDFLGRELDELKEDIDRFRDLEAEHAEKLVEAKGEMKVQLENDLAELVEKMNTFLEMRLANELEELKEDLTEAKELQFGRELFEGFVQEYRKNFIEEGSVEAELREAHEKLAEVTGLLAEAEDHAAEQARAAKMAELLDSLEGRRREVMESILANVPTDQLDEGYKTFIGRVLNEKTEESTPAKEEEVLAESDSEEQVENISEGVVVTGDTEEVLEEGTADEAPAVEVNPQLEQLRKLAGI
jgi:hypothetical protein